MIFIRPWALLFLLVPLLLHYIHVRLNPENPWKGIISPKLLPYLLVKDGTMRHRKAMWWFLFLWVSLSVAAAGPAFERIKTPGITTVPGTVLVVDLNSMNPEKLSRLKIKLFDLLNSLDGEQVGLVLYDQEGYVVTPLTQDLRIIKEIVPTLNPNVLPAVGNYVESGFETALQLLKNAGLRKGRIIFITGGGVDVTKAVELMRNTSHKVGILGIGDEKMGEPILSPNGYFLRDEKGNLQLVHLDSDALSSLGKYIQEVPDGSDIQRLLTQTEIKKDSVFYAQEMKDGLFESDEWWDLGIYLALISTPFVALLFRKGMFFLLIVCFLSTSVVANPWTRPDQLSYQEIESGIQFYRQKRYDEALTTFQKVQTLEAIYNAGNSLAQLGRIPEAITAYETVLNKQPEHKEAAFNKAYLEKLLSSHLQQQSAQSDSQNQSGQDSDSSDETGVLEKDVNSKEQLKKRNPKENIQAQSDVSDKDQTKRNNAISDSSENQFQNSNSEKLSSTDGSAYSQSQKKSEQFGEKHNQKELIDQENKFQNLQKQDLSRDRNGQKEQENFSDQIYPMPSQSNGENSSAEKSNIPDQFVSDDEEASRLKSGINHNSIISQEKQLSDISDQETQELFNRLKRDPSRILRYRLRKQNRRM